MIVIKRLQMNQISALNNPKVVDMLLNETRQSMCYQAKIVQQQIWENWFWEYQNLQHTGLTNQLLHGDAISCSLLKLMLIF